MLAFFPPAAAHDAAKINSLRGIDVRLVRTGGQLGAQCVERKQPPPQDAPDTQLRPRTCVSLSFGASRAFTHACFATLLMRMIVVALQSQHTLTSRRPRRDTTRVTRSKSYLGRCFSEEGDPISPSLLASGACFAAAKNNAAGCCKGTVGNRFARGRMLTVNKFTHEQ